MEAKERRETIGLSGADCKEDRTATATEKSIAASWTNKATRHLHGRELTIDKIRQLTARREEKETVDNGERRRGGIDDAIEEKEEETADGDERRRGEISDAIEKEDKEENEIVDGEERKKREIDGEG